MENTNCNNSVCNNSIISINNKKIKDFYDKNSNINFENINLYLIDLFESIIEDNSINEYNLKKIIKENQLIGEKQMEIMLCNICPTDRIIKNTNMSMHCDYIIKSQNKPQIMIESKETNVNVDIDIIDLFISSIKENNCCGIFISQHSGIINKPSFKIEIYNGNILIYIANCNYDIEKIKNSIEIIYTLYDKLKLFNDKLNPTINASLLIEINKEYQVFLNYKESMIKFIKENNNNLIKNIENFKFDTLDKYLSTKFIISQNNLYIHKCNLCNIYTSKTLKGIAAHKKGCKKKISIYK